MAGAFGEGVDDETKNFIRKASVCERMGWTFRDYDKHTAKEINCLIAFLNAREEKLRQMRDLRNG